MASAMISSAKGPGKQLRIIFIGDSGVGKTSIFKLFENHEVFKSPLVTIHAQTIERNIVIEPSHQTVKVRIKIPLYNDILFLALGL